MAGCYSTLKPKTIGPHEYVFLEHYVETQGILADNPYINAYVYMGYPTYNSTTSQSILKAVRIPTLNENLKFMLGNGKARGKNACHEGEMYMYGEYKLPYNQNNIIIKNINQKGTTYLDYDGKSLVLESGASWYNNSSRIQLIHFTNNTVDENIKVNISVMDRFKNFGIYTKGLE
jgi:hypothetical protein